MIDELIVTPALPDTLCTTSLKARQWKPPWGDPSISPTEGTDTSSAHKALADNACPDNALADCTPADNDPANVVAFSTAVPTSASISPLLSVPEEVVNAHIGAAGDRYSSAAIHSTIGRMSHDDARQNSDNTLDDTALLADNELVDNTLADDALTDTTVLSPSTAVPNTLLSEFLSTPSQDVRACQQLAHASLDSHDAACTTRARHILTHLNVTEEQSTLHVSSNLLYDTTLADNTPAENQPANNTSADNSLADNALADIALADNALAAQVHIIADLQNNLAQLSAVLTAFRQTHAND